MNETLARGPKGPKAMLALVEKWKSVPEGTPVIVIKDDGTEVKTKTRSIPWMLGSSSRGPGHTAVIMVEGITGGYGLWRVRLDQKPKLSLADVPPYHENPDYEAFFKD
jgi:hypothetical protein